MKQNSILADLISALQKEMISSNKTGSVFKHPSDNGNNTEQTWIDWFQRHLPNRYKANKATVFDSKGNESDQIDVVLYDDQYSYLAFNKHDTLYIPAESVYAVFEIKPELNKTHMEYAGMKAETVRRLYRTSAPIPHAGGVYSPKPLHRIYAGLLTTRSGWVNAFGKPFEKCLNSYSKEQQIDCGCVLEAGSFYYDYGTKNIRKSNSTESLVFFFMQLLATLQSMGTVPAIDLNEYMKALSITEDNLNG